MARVCRTILIALSLSVFAAEVTAQSLTSPCAKTITQQDAWVRRVVDLIIRRAHAAYEDESAEKAYVRSQRMIANTIKQCKLAENTEFMSRYPEFVEYIRVLSLEHERDHELGFEVPDKVYFAETGTFVTIPDFLLNTEFLQAVRRFETLPKGKAWLRAINAARPKEKQLLVLSFESRHLGTPDTDDSYRRLLVVVPGEPDRNIPEKWVQFGITDPGKRVPVRNLSVVAVVPGEKSSKIYFKDYFRTYRRDGSVAVKGRWELGYGDDNCVKCHKSGVLPIFPVDGSVSKDEKAVVDGVNRRFLAYSAPDFGRYLDPTKFGPGLGSLRTTANAQLTGTACASCHQPNGLGSLNWPMDSVLISSFVEGGRMPLGSNLNELERTNLYKQLIEEYFSIDNKQPGILKSWLLRKNVR
jgi:hypothetical protein